MKCPECSGNNCYEIDPDAEPYVIEETDDGLVHIEIKVECYDCGCTFSWDVWE